jgi:hypothetical protein
MKRNPFFRLLARLRVGRKLLLIYLLDLSAVVYISGILIHEKYISIDFSNKEIIGNAYIGTVRDALIDVAMTGAGQRPPVARLNDAQADLVKTEAGFGAHLQSADLNTRVRAALGVLSREAQPTPAEINEALDACRELVTRVGNQSNLILDPDLDSYYAMSLSILRYPALLDSVNHIGRQLHEGARASRSHDELRARYLVLEGQLDAVLQGLRSDFSEAGAANHAVDSALGPSMSRMLTAVEAYRHAARIVIDSNGEVDPALLSIVDVQQQTLIAGVRDTWRTTVCCMRACADCSRACGCISAQRCSCCAAFSAWSISSRSRFRGRCASLRG